MTMKQYKVWIQIEEVDEEKDVYRNIDEPHEAGTFAYKKDAEAFVNRQLFMAHIFALRLLQISEAGIKFLASLPQTEFTSEQQNRKAFGKMLEDAAKMPAIAVDNRCPACGASSQERTLVKMDDRGCEAIHLRYTCNKCRKMVVEKFTLGEVFIDDGT
jgi:hypothetical protein